MKLLSLKNYNQKGDTIVEVLIAIAVVSSVLGITYSIMNRNITTIRDNQERSEASKLAQGQLELLRSSWVNSQFDSSALSNSNFCLAVDAGNIVSVGVYDPNNLSPIGYPDSYGRSCIQDIYHYSMTKNNSEPGNLSYTVTVRWNRIGGGVSQVFMAYKVQ